MITEVIKSIIKAEKEAEAIRLDAEDTVHKTESKTHLEIEKMKELSEKNVQETIQLMSMKNETMENQDILDINTNENKELENKINEARRFIIKNLLGAEK